jgi:uncharacterized protein
LRTASASPGAWHTLVGADLLLRVRVQPRATPEGPAGMHGERLRVRVGAPALEEKANARLIELLAARLGVARAAVSIVRGARTRDKELLVRGGAARAGELLARLSASAPARRERAKSAVRVADARENPGKKGF